MIVGRRYRNLKSWIPILFVVSFFLYYSHKIPILICNFHYILISIIGFFTVFKRKIKRDRYFVVLFCLMIVIFGISSGIYTGDLNYSIYFKSICYVFIAVFIFEYSVPKVAIRFLYYGVAMWFILTLIDRNVDTNNYFLKLSRNYFSILMLALLCLYYISIVDKKCLKIPMFPAIIYLVISLLAIGRGGIISAILLIFGIAFINYWVYQEDYKKRILFVYSGIFLVVFMAVVGKELGIVDVWFSRFEMLGMKSQGRSLIWNQYFSLVFHSLKNLIFGCSLQNIEIFERYAFNLHNSFLQMHCTYGLVFSMAVLFGLMTSLWKCYQNKEFLVMLLEIVFLFRASTDEMGFAFFTEFLFYYFLLYCLFDKKKVNL